jgi:hypothetical protein
MAKRLNDTVGLRSVSLRGGDTPSPDAGVACLRRSPRPGEASVAYSPEGGPELCLRPQPDVGSESLRGATAYLGERIGSRGTGREE